MKNLLQDLYSPKPTIDKRVREIANKARTKISKYFRLPEYLLEVSKYVITDLPTIYKVVKIGGYPKGYGKNYAEIYIKKIIGAFNVLTDTIYIDKSLVGNTYQLFKTFIHEYVHKAQTLLGRICRYTRDFIEREAHRITEQIIRFI